MSTFIKRIRAAVVRAAGMFGGAGAERATRDEFESHIELHTAENIRRGMNPGDARRDALLAAGGLTQAAELVRDRRRLPWVEALVADLRYSMRSLARSPGYTAVAALTLALGIGANTAIFSVVNGVVLRPLPYPDPERLVWVGSMRAGKPTSVSGPDFIDWKSQTRSFSGLVASFTSTTVLTGSGDPIRLSQARVTANAFDVFALRPVIGRAFANGEDEVSAPRVAMLSEALWRSRFGADSTVVGRTMVFDGNPTTIIGVAPAAMSWPDASDVWMTTRFTPRDVAPAGRGARWLTVAGRLKPGVSARAAKREMVGIATALEKLDPQHNTNVSANVTPLLESTVGSVQHALFVLLGAVAFVLLIACANVASLSLARVASRDGELAVRTALGAGRSRIVRQLLTESLLLAFVGGTLGILLAFAGVRVLVAIAPADLPRLDTISLDAPVLLFAFVATSITGVLFGVVPAMQGAASNLHDRLRSAGRGSFGQRLGTRTRRMLVVGEMALAVVLLSGAGLLLRSFASLREVDPGFRAEQAATFNVSLPSGGNYQTREQRMQFNATLLAGIARTPGVSAVASTIGLPLSGDNLGFTFVVQGAAPPPLDKEPRAEARIASPDYFKAMGIPVIRGRVFNEADRDGARQVLVISREVERLFFPNEDPIGKYLETGWGMNGKKFGGEVIGVVGDVRQYTLDKDRTAHMYMAYDQWPLDDYDVVVRSTGTSGSVFTAARAVLRSLDTQLPLNGARTLGDILDRSLGQRKFYMNLLTAFACVAMSLAVVGIYGVIAYGVQQRKREIGIRLALGASARGVVRMVLSDGLRLVVAGTALGVAGSYALTRVLGALLFQTDARDPLTLVVCTVLLTIAATCACLIPARKASRLSPTDSIRAD